MPTSAPTLETHPRTTADRVIRAGFRVLNYTTPALGARVAEELFFTPPRPRRSPRIERFLASGRRFEVRAASRRVSAWTWGRGPRVYLVHGWGGRGGQLGAFVEPLVARGLSVVAFDAPGHGASEGRRTSLLEFYEALRVLVDTLGAGHGVVAHSLGAPATALALQRGVALGRAVFVAAPANPADWTRRFASRFRIAPRLLATMQAQSERRLGFRWEDLKVTTLARDLATPLLIVHDEDDADVPWSDGALIADAWSGARLLTTRGLGHRQILRDPGVVEAVTAFLLGGPLGKPESAAAQPVEAGVPGTASSPSASAELERYLFQRDSRRERRAVLDR